MQFSITPDILTSVRKAARGMLAGNQDQASFNVGDSSVVISRTSNGIQEMFCVFAGGSRFCVGIPQMANKRLVEN